MARGPFEFDEFDDDISGDEGEVCLHGVPWCEECEACNQVEDEADGIS